VTRKAKIEGLWTCPRCGRMLVGRKMSHSCSEATADDFLRRASAAIRDRYDRLEAMIAACGPYRVSPPKTRIAFMAKVRFAGVTAVNHRSLTPSFALPAPLSSSRFLDVKEIVPGWWAHRMRVTTREDLDDELQGWLREPYRLMGIQEWLAGPTTSRRRARGRSRWPAVGWSLP